MRKPRPKPSSSPDRNSPLTNSLFDGRKDLFEALSGKVPEKPTSLSHEALKPTPIIALSDANISSDEAEWSGAVNSNFYDDNVEAFSVLPDDYERGERGRGLLEDTLREIRINSNDELDLRIQDRSKRYLEGWEEVVEEEIRRYIRDRRHKRDTRQRLFKIIVGKGKHQLKAFAFSLIDDLIDSESLLQRAFYDREEGAVKVEVAKGA